MQRPTTGVLLAGLAAALLAAAGCQRRDIPSGPSADIRIDPGAEPVDVAAEDTGPDLVVDPPPPDSDDPGDDDERPEPSCPPESVVGVACADSSACGDLSCLVEMSHTYDGLLYVDWPAGYCVDPSWDSGCDPDDAAACPEGARCVHLGAARCEDRWACLDACAPADTAGVPFGFNACCRPGYRCDLALGVCLPGCMSDRECCEVWSDEDGDTVRTTGEVSLKSGCTRTCDGDTYACVGPGDGTFASACTFDADCPDGAACLAEGCSSTYGGPFPGGLCIRERCDLAGISCTGGGGACVDVRGQAVCLASCTSGLPPGDPSSDCRDGYACVPACDGDWVGTPPAGDGFCMPASASTAGEETRYASCAGDGDCHSPLGLGLCLLTAADTRCSVRCNAGLASGSDVCGAPGTPGDPPPGACWACHCRKACGDPTAPLSADSCGASGALACYPAGSLFGEIAHSAAASAPAGLCLPACADTADCTALWGMPLGCDTVTGTCS